MLEDHYSRVENLFHAALERGPEFLEAACGGDRALQSEVAELLASHRAWSAGLLAPPEPSLPRFGPYECDAVLGAGGMGTVYRAHRADGQFSQEVAIKVLRGSLRSDWYRQRFLAERQILAQLNHPHIARLLDGGMTDDGEPYLAMELVEGQPIDAYCDGHLLSIAARIKLFDQVLDAVDYAHRHLIVHRDLKPSNIFVTSAGQVKLLDFGTSKLIEDESAATAHRALTPRYASPEQLKGEPVAIASDVFSAGVVLYELLAGAGPFGAGESVVASLERAVGKMDPLAPAAAVTEDAARNRSSNAKALRNALSGDLSSILLKSLSNSPGSRYPTAAGLREDLERYQAGRPVLAKQPTALYRTQKFVRRHTWSVTFAAIFIIGLAGAATFSMWQARVARQQADRAERINAFLNDMLGSPNPSWYNTLRNKGKNVTMLDVLDELRGRIGKELADQPQVEVELRQTLGRLYFTLGQHQQAREQLELALDRQIRTTGRNHPEVGILYKNLAFDDFLSRRNAEALRNATESLAILNRSGRKQDRQAIVEAYDVAALALYKSGRPLPEAEQPLREALSRSRQWFGDGGSTPALLGTLATFAVEQGKFEDAVRLSNECLALYRAKAGPMPVESFTPLRNLAMVCLEDKDYSCAESRLREALDTSGKDLGHDNLYNMNLRAYYALAIGLAGRAPEAEKELTEYIRKTPVTGDSADLYVAMGQEFLGRVQMAAGELDAAAANLREALATYRQYRHSGDVRNAVTASRLGECLLAQNLRDKALPLLHESYDTILKTVGPSHIWSVQARDRLAKGTAAPSAKKM